MIKKTNVVLSPLRIVPTRAKITEISNSNPDCANDIAAGTKFKSNYEEAVDEEMIIEDWMLQEFNVNPVNKNMIKDEAVQEEEMEIEDWMLNIDHWLAVLK